MTLNTLLHRITSTRAVTPLLLTFFLAVNSAYGGTLSQNTSGILHSVSGEDGIRLENRIGFSTSGGPSGPASENLFIQLDAPDGEVFRFDDSAYPGSTFSLEFRPIVSGDMTGITVSNPTFELVNPSGTLAVTESSADAGIFSGTLYLNSNQIISGTGTFSGFRLTTQLTGAGGQQLTWGGGDGKISGFVGSDAGPVLTSVVVPEPGTLGLLAATAVGASCLVRRRQPAAERR